LNYLPCLLETILLLVTLLAISLNVLTQLLLEGEVTRPLFGHARTLAPKWDEDFAIVLLRLGTASLEATSVAGLGRELGPVPVRDSGVLTKSSEANSGIVELAGGGIMSITASKFSKGKGGFANEIKTVKVKADDGNPLIDQKWLRGLLQYGSALLAVVRGFYRLVLWAIWYRWRVPAPRGSGDEGQESGSSEKSKPSLSSRRRSREDEDSLYRRFLDGEVVSDDEDTDYSPTLDATLDSQPVSSDDEGDQEYEIEDSDTGGKETVNLYSDILDPSTSVPSLSPGPVLFAHMTATSDMPLTRRRYNQLLSTQQRQIAEDDDVGWMALVQDRQAKRHRLLEKVL